MKAIEILQRLKKVDGSGFDFWAIPNENIHVGFSFNYNNKLYQIISCGDPGATSIKSDKGNWNTTRFSAILLKY